MCEVECDVSHALRKYDLRWPWGIVLISHEEVRSYYDSGLLSRITRERHLASIVV